MKTPLVRVLKQVLKENVNSPQRLLEDLELSLNPENKQVYAVRYGDGEVDGCWVSKKAVQRFIDDIRAEIRNGEYDPDDYEPMIIITRMVTKIPDLVSEWKVCR